MSPEAHAITFALAILCFAIAAVLEWVRSERPPSQLLFIAAGLAVFVFAFFWDAVKAA